MPILYETHETLKPLEATLLRLVRTMNSEDGGLAVSTWLDKEPGDLDEKLEYLGRLVQEVRARVERRQRESFRFRALAAIDNEMLGDIWTGIRECFEARGIDHVETTSFRIAMRECEDSAPMEWSQDEVTDEFRTAVVDRRKLRKALEAGRELPFARLLKRNVELDLR